MKTLNAPDTISGKEGRAYAKINGNNEELFMAKTIEANVEKNKSEHDAPFPRHDQAVEGNRRRRVFRHGGRE